MENEQDCIFANNFAHYTTSNENYSIYYVQPIETDAENYSNVIYMQLLDSAHY